MIRRFTDDEVRLTRARSQRLLGDRAEGVAAVVREMVGVQSQNVAAARLALRPRTDGVDAGAVTRACNEDRTVVRTWAMRGTLHMITAEDVGWVVGLFGPLFAAADRRRRLQLGLDDEMLERAVPVLCGIVADEGPLVRADLVRRLGAAGVSVDPRSQAPAHLIGYAAMRGLICRGPDVAKDEPTYVLVEEWAGKQRELGPDESLAELTRRYVASRGPVTPEDLAKWSGLPARQARRGFDLVADELREVAAGGGAAWVTHGTAAQQGGQPSVRLVGHFDEYLLGYAGRDLVLEPRFAKRIQAGGGFIQPAVLLDGRVVGTWKQQRRKDRLLVEVQPFVRLPAAAGPGLESEAADIGRFLGTDADLRIADPA